MKFFLKRKISQQCQLNMVENNITFCFLQLKKQVINGRRFNNIKQNKLPQRKRKHPPINPNQKNNDLFKACGEIEILCIKSKLGEGRVCYIRFNNNGSAQTALLLNDQTLDSKPLQIKLINPNTNSITATDINDKIDQQQTALETVHSMSTCGLIKLQSLFVHARLEKTAKKLVKIPGKLRKYLTQNRI